MFRGRRERAESPGDLLKRASLALAIALASFSSALAATIRLPQADGTMLALERPAASLITLSPHLTELAFAAGAGGRVIAAVAYSEYPPDAARLPRVGDAFRLDLERILTLRPDLVLAWESGNPRPAVARLQALGLPVWLIEIRSPGEIATVLELIGRAAGTTQIAGPAAENTRRKLDTLIRDHAGRPPVRYFYQVAERPLFTIGGDHLIARSLSLCGGHNVFADAGALAPQVTQEAVIAANPDAFLAPSLGSGDDPLAAWRDWPGLRAVRNEALYLLPADEISRATPRMLDAIATACRLLHRAASGERHE